MPLSPRVSLAQVAAACGLSVSGVCRGLKNDERIPLPTRARIKQVAARLGYRPDPGISEAFRRVGRAKRGRYVETLAFLTFHEAPLTEAGTDFRRKLFASALRRAESLGYRLEEFWAEAPGLTRQRLARILHSRGIRGCLLAPCPGDRDDIGLPWQKLACVALTYTIRTPVHRAVPFHYGNLRLAVAEAERAGYRRIGLVVERSHNQRTLFFYAAAYLNEVRERPRLFFAPILEFADLGESPQIVSWARRHRLDLIIASHAEMLVRMEEAGAALPPKIGFIGMGNGRPVAHVSHIDQQPEEAGPAGLDLLCAMLESGEMGLPASPRVLMIQGRWCQGATTKRGL